MTRIRFVLALVAVACLLGIVAADQEAKDVKGWGAVTDPDGDCTVKVADGKLIVTVPGTPHDLSVYYDKKNAPPRSTRG